MSIVNKISETVQNTTRSNINLVKGTVVNYDSTNNLADVYIDSLSSGGDTTLTDVPIQISSKGVHSSGLSINDIVYIQFANSSLFQPKIVGIADEVYAYNTRIKERHLRKGELTVNQDTLDGEITSPSCKTWIDNDNIHLAKTGEFFNQNAIDNADKLMFSKGNFNGQDIGIYNPVSSSVIKITDNGVINIFVETNTGIKIDPTNKTIEILGNNVCTKTENWSVITNSIDIKARDKITITARELELNVDNITGVK
ncbi:hypothetical protein [Clostridium sp. YIM B02555]|uniref:hypothetical protein n=1 Tax=Clostridium sp. YIM B02555 TaxID=2911968 RepID=UPI001EEE2DEC|nr:hypothetical protein [Clostridium sp. YIM B02555]